MGAKKTRLTPAPERRRINVMDLRACPGWDGAGAPGGRLPRPEPGAGSVRPGAAQRRRLTGELLIGPPKSKAGRRVVGIPSAVVPALHEHLATFVKGNPGALVFPGVKGGLLRRSNFNKMSAVRGAVHRS